MKKHVRFAAMLLCALLCLAAHTAFADTIYKTPTVQMGEISLHADKDYLGLDIPFEALNLENCASLRIDVYSSSMRLTGATAANLSSWKDGAHSFTLYVKQGLSEMRTDWNYSDYTPNASFAPYKVVFTTVDTNGETKKTEYRVSSTVSGKWKTLFSDVDLGVSFNITDFSAHKDSDFVGINVAFTAQNIEVLTDLKLELMSGERVLSTRTADMEKLIASQKTQFVEPFTVSRRTWQEDGIFSWEEYTPSTVRRPSKVVLTATDMYGREYTETVLTLNEDSAQWEDIFEPYTDLTVTNGSFVTHSGTDYIGIEERFTLAPMEQVQRVEVALYSDKKLLVTSVAEDASLLSKDSIVIPMRMRTGTATDDGVWSVTEFAAQANYKPNRFVVTATDIYGAQVIQEFTGLDETAQSYSSLFDAQDLGLGIVIDEFEGHLDDQYTGLDVAFSIADIRGAKSVRVAVMSLSSTITSAEADIADIVQGEDGKYHLVFLASGGEEMTQTGWRIEEFEPSAESKPTRVVLTVTDIYGDTHTVTRQTLDETKAKWEDIVSNRPVMTVNVTNVSAHADENWLGLNVYFDCLYMTKCKSLKLELFAGKKSIGVLTAVNPQALSGGSHTIPVVVQYGLGEKNSEWTVTGFAPSASTVPTLAVLTGTAPDGQQVVSKFTLNKNVGAAWKKLFSAPDLGISVTEGKASVHDDAQYTGIALSWKIQGAACAKSAKVTLKSGKTQLATGTVSVLKDGTVQTPFVWKKGTLASDSAWQQGTFAALRESPCDSVVVTVTDVYGYTKDYTFSGISASEWKTLFADTENAKASLHSGRDYLGLDVSFDVTNIKRVKKLQVVVMSGKTTLVTATTEKSSEWESGAVSLALHAKTGLGEKNMNWTYSAFTCTEKLAADSLQVILTDEDGKTTTQKVKLSLKKTWKTITTSPDLGLTAQVTRFALHDGTDFKGIDVAYSVSDPELVQSVQVVLLAGKKELARTDSLPILLSDYAFVKKTQPTEVDILVTDIYGFVHTYKSTSLDQSETTWANFFPEPDTLALSESDVSVHCDTDYLGLDVSFKLTHANCCGGVTVEALSGSKVVMSAARVSGFAEGDNTMHLYAKMGNGEKDALWTYSTPLASQPDSVRITAINEKGKKITAKIALTSAQKAAYKQMMTLPDLGIDGQITKFCVHKGTDYSGLELDYSVQGGVKAEIALYSGKTLLLRTDKKQIALSDFAARRDNAPTRADLIVTDVYGNERTFTGIAPDETNVKWADLFLNVAGQSVSIHEDRDYLGVDAAFTIVNSKECADLTVELYNNSTSLMKATAKSVPADGTITVPLYGKMGTGTQNANWNYTAPVFTENATHVLITATDKSGEKVTARIALTAEQKQAYANMVNLPDLGITGEITKFAVHNGTDYSGIDIAFTQNGGQKAEIALYSGNTLLLRTQKLPITLSDFAAKRDNAPTRCELIVTDLYGYEHVFASDTLDETNAKWADMFLNVEGKSVSIHESTDYLGVDTTFSIANASLCGNLTVELYNGTTVLMQATAKTIPADGTVTVPLYGKMGTGTQSANWNYTTPVFTAKATHVLITATNKNGEKVTAKIELTDAQKAAYTQMVTLPGLGITGEITKFATHKGDDYIGIDVQYTVTGGVKTELALYSGSTLLLRTDKTPIALSDYASDRYVKPSVIELIVTDMYGYEHVFSREKLDTTTYSWIDLFPEIKELTLEAQGISIHAGTDYLGVETEFTIKNADLCSALTVELFNGNKSLVKATANTIPSDGNVVVSLYGKMGTATQCADWTYTTPVFGATPTYVLITGTDTDGKTVTTKITLTNAQKTAYKQMVTLPDLGITGEITKFAPHKGSDYCGIDVQYNANGGVKTEIALYSGTKQLLRTEKTAITFADYAFKRSEKPSRVDLIVTDLYGYEHVFASGALQETGTKWEDLFLNVAGQDVSVHEGTDYLGVDVTFTLQNAAQCTALSVELYNGTNVLLKAAANTVPTEGSVTVPLYGKMGNAAQNASWTYATPVFTATATHVLITATDTDGKKVTAKIELTAAQKAAYKQMVTLPDLGITGAITKFATHKGDDYCGIDVQYTANGGAKTEFALYSGSKLLLRTEKAPISIEDYASDRAVVPTRVDLIVTDLYGYEHVFTSGTLDETASAWADLFPEILVLSIQDASVSIHEDTDYLGVDTEFALRNPGLCTALTVELYNNTKVLMKATANTIPTGGRVTVPLYGKMGTGTQIEGWTYTKPTFTATATHVLITATGTDGKKVTAKITFTTAQKAAYKQMVNSPDLGITGAITKFATHKGDDYCGIDVQYTANGGAKTEFALYSGSKLLLRTEKAPISIEDYASDRDVIPTRVDLIVTDLYGYEHVFASGALDETASAWADLFPEILVLSIQDASVAIHEDTDYLGVDTEFALRNPGLCTALTVELYNNTKVLMKATASTIPTDGRVTVPLYGKMGTGTQIEGWTYTKPTFTATATHVLITATGTDGKKVTAKITFTTAQKAAYKQMVNSPDLGITGAITKFATHKGDDFTGIDIAYTANGGAKTEFALYSGKTLLLRTEKTPVALQDYAANRTVKPDKVSLIITDVYGNEHVFTANKLDETECAWNDLFPAEAKLVLTGKSACVHQGTDYLGLEVEFTVSGIQECMELTVGAYKGKTVLMQAKALAMPENGTVTLSLHAMSGLASPDDSWTYIKPTFSQSKAPTEVRITGTDTRGKNVTATIKLSAKEKAAWKQMAKEPQLGIAVSDIQASGNKNSAYNGVDVSWKLTTPENGCKGIKLSLYNNKTMIGSGSCAQVASSARMVLTENGEYADDSAWQWEKGKVAANTAPNKVEIVVSDLYGFSHTFTSSVSIGNWKELMTPYTAITLSDCSMATHGDAQYKGVDCAFTVANTQNLQSLKVQLYSGKTLVAEATTEDASVWENGSVAMPFLIAKGLSEGDGRWKYPTMKLRLGAKPSRMLVTATDENGAQVNCETAVLNETDCIWQSLYAVLDLGIEADIESLTVIRNDTFQGLELSGSVEGANLLRSINVAIKSGKTVLASGTGKIENIAREGTIDLNISFAVKETGNDGKWSCTALTCNENKIPNTVEVTAVDLYGDSHVFSTSVSLTEGEDETWDNLCGFIEPGLKNIALTTHVGRDYTGLEASFDLKHPEVVNKIVMELYSGSKLIARNTTEKSFVTREAGTFTVPFYVHRGSFVVGSNHWWHFKKNVITIETVPTELVFIVDTTEGRSYTYTHTSLEEGNIPFEEIFNIPERISTLSVTSFRTVKTTDYTGIALDMGITGAEDLAEIRLALYSGSTNLADVTLDASKVSDDFTFIFPVQGTNAASTGMIATAKKQYNAGKTYPVTKAEVTITDYFGNTVSKTMDTLDTTSATWEELFEQAAPDSKDAEEASEEECAEEASEEECTEEASEEECTEEASAEESAEEAETSEEPETDSPEETVPEEADFT